MPIEFSMTFSFGIIKDGHSLVCLRDLGSDIPSLFSHSVADHEHLDVRNRLSQHTRHAGPQSRSMVMRGNHDCRSERGVFVHVTPANCRRSWIRSTIRTPSS